MPENLQRTARKLLHSRSKRKFENTSSPYLAHQRRSTLASVVLVLVLEYLFVTKSGLFSGIDYNLLANPVAFFSGAGMAFFVLLAFCLPPVIVGIVMHHKTDPTRRQFQRRNWAKLSNKKREEALLESERLYKRDMKQAQNHFFVTTIHREERAAEEARVRRNQDIKERMPVQDENFEMPINEDAELKHGKYFEKVYVNPLDKRFYETV